MKPVNALTIDVEDYFQVTAFEREIPRNDWASFPSRVEQNTRRLLERLAANRVSATFFVLGWTATQYPHLIREIADAGHEIGSHSYWHHLIYEQSPAEFRADLCRSRDVLEGIVGAPVVAYRAPSFSITTSSLWAIDILAEEGFRVDASIFPIWHDRYGIPDAPLHIHSHRTAHGDVWEFPSTVFTCGPLRIPVSGGGYFRLLPYWLTARMLKRINQTRPFIFYIHPWEIDPGQPRLKLGRRTSRFRHRVNLQTTEQKLDRLLNDFAFGSISQAMSADVASACGETSKAANAPPQQPAPLGRVDG